MQILKKCKVCGTEFRARQKNYVTCSPECSYANNLAHTKKRQQQQSDKQRKRSYTPPKAWTEEDTLKLKELAEKYHRYVDIANEMGRTANVIKLHCEDLGLEIGVRHWKSWEDKDDELLEELYYRYWTYPEIAEELGRTVRAVQGRIQTLGLAQERRDKKNADFKKKLKGVYDI